MTPYQRHIASLDSIPPEIRDLPIWCAWRLVKKVGKVKPDKVPVSPITSRGDEWTKAGFCTPAQRAIDYAESRKELHGIGLVLYPEFGIAGGDLDQCRDPETGAPSERAAGILATANTYTEVSPSLSGYRFLAFGSFGGYTGNDNNIGIEFYETRRFLTFTGEHVENNSPFAIEERDLTELGKRYFSEKKKEPTGGNDDVGEFAPVDIQTLGLEPWTLETIATGGDGNDRSVTLFGVIKDMARAGCDDLTICRVCADPRNGISEKALENRGGNLQSAMRWVAPQIPKAREILSEKAKNLAAMGKILDEKPFSLAQFSMVADIKKLETKLQTDVFVLGRIALMGQATVIFAQPNAGKTLITLKLLIEAIKSGRVDAQSVFYINADDNYRGLITKAKLAARYGFHMLAPDHHGFDPAKFQAYVDQIVTQDKARGSIVVLDTLKKFADTMDKRKSSEFNKTIRRFVLGGGTLIALAHVNKHKGADGKVIHAGTSDTLDDFDAAYVVEVVKRDATEVVVCFENRKNRGDNAQQASYSYAGKATVSSYFDLFDSIEALDDETVKHNRALVEATKRVQKNEQIIGALLDAMLEGHKTQSEIVSVAATSSGLGKIKLRQALIEHTGDDFLMGHCWTVNVADKNAHVYEPLPLAVKTYTTEKTHKTHKTGKREIVESPEPCEMVEHGQH